MNCKWIEGVDFEHGWLAIAVLLPAVAYSIVALDIFWTLAALAAIALTLAPLLLGTKPLPLALVLALLSSFQPFALGGIIGLDSQTAMAVEMFLQAWFVYFFSLTCMVLVSERLKLEISPGYGVFMTVMASVTLSTVLGILAFFVDRVFSTNLLPSNTFLMLQLSTAFFGSIFLGLVSIWYIKRVEHFSGEISNGRPVED